MIRRITFAGEEIPSFERAAVIVKQVGGAEVSAKTVERITHQIGVELGEIRDTGEVIANAPAEPPDLAVIEIDGGRVLTRSAGQGPGVHGPAWRENKNACLIRMQSEEHERDPHPALPEAFCNHEHVAEIAGFSVPENLLVPESRSLLDDCMRSTEWRPERLFRTVVSSMVDSREFGSMVTVEAEARRFDEAQKKAFLGDGLGYNWAIWRDCFPDYVPIVDFIHVLEYTYAAARTMESDIDQAWSVYLAMAEACWQGRVTDVIGLLDTWLRKTGWSAGETISEDDWRWKVFAAHRYFTNNQSRMDYARYRQQGLPVTSALAESLVKEINLRVKGTEMFWNDPDGAEAILQVRAAALSEDDRLENYLLSRPGCVSVRRTTQQTAA